MIASVVLSSVSKWRVDDIPCESQEDKPWEWNRLFAELSPDVQSVWDRLSGTESKPDGGTAID